ncbi:hypothetical protein QFC24_004778 [Naganishia onofrii]|uniref:Uncharacterized protein n=1 Tax=Naganishia onofrii TaxID=1851511 RepID=A0ACC2XDJ7_9TREE|nr:hypothetical protein QFC24_004778 [Naganishia onofrii]
MCQGWMYKRSVEVWNAKQTKAKRDKPPNPGETEFSRKILYWESGLQPQIVREAIKEFDKKRREAKTKAISEVLKKKDKAEKERKEIYAERRRVCVPAILIEGGLADLSRAPILENAPVLLTSTDERYAGDGAKERTVPTWFKYPSESSSSKDKDKGADGKSDKSKK